MDLVAIAEDAQEVASEVLEFEDFLPSDRATDISALATELFSLKTTLLELNNAQNQPRNQRRAESIEEERYIVCQSLRFTFKDIHEIIGGLASPTYRSRGDAYRATWRKLEDHFYAESRNELVARLQYYKSFIQELTALVIGERPYPEFEELLARIDHLLEVQEESRLALGIENLDVGAPRVRSFERTRPYGLDRNGQPTGRTAREREHQTGRRPQVRRPLSPGFPGQGFPEVPSSPSVTTGSTFTESSDTESNTAKHWIIDVFSQQRTNTQFRTSGPESACFGEHQRGASQKLKQDHERTITLPYEQLELRVYIRERDQRARLWCRMDRRERRVESIQAVSKLRILRKDSCLQICKPSSSGKLQLWANLRYSSYERLVLFYCTFLALKAQDEGDPVHDLDDHILHGEVMAFSGKILDDNYNHALQIFKDEDSGGVRLQASILRGPMKRYRAPGDAVGGADWNRAPVWTAFITYSMMARTWIKRAEPKKVHLMELNRYIFFPDYMPQMAPNGAHELHFLAKEDAANFVRAIDDVAEGRI